MENLKYITTAGRHYLVTQDKHEAINALNGTKFKKHRDVAMVTAGEKSAKEIVECVNSHSEMLMMIDDLVFALETKNGGETEMTRRARGLYIGS